MRFHSIATVLATASIALIGLSAPIWAASVESALRQLDNPVSSDSTLGKFEGRWNGDGVARQSSEGREEPVKCRLTSTWAAENKLMRMQLACRGIDYVFTANSFIGRSGNVYRGSLNSSVSGEANVAGKRSGSGLVFNVAGGTKNRDSNSQLTLQIGGNGVTNTVQRTDPRTGQRYVALKVTMSKS